MKYTKKILLIIFILISSLFASFEFGLQLGSMGPDEDPLVRESFGYALNSDIYFGFICDKGFELRFDIDSYGAKSHNPSDEGTGLKLGIGALEMNLIYNISRSKIRPYIGVGVGSYSYHLSSTLVEEIEKDSIGGTNALIGIKWLPAEFVFFNIEYQRHYIPRIIFANANNFNMSSLTFGIGFIIDGKSSCEKNPNYVYPYNRKQEKLLVEIQQINRERELLANRRKKIEKDIKLVLKDHNTIYFKTFFKDYEIHQQDIKIINSRIAKAEKHLNQLTTSWNKIRPHTKALRYHVAYIRSNYKCSPFGLRYRNRYLTYKTNYKYLYYYHGHNVNKNRYIKKSTSKTTTTKKEPTPQEKAQYEKQKQAALEKIKNREQAEKQTEAKQETPPYKKIDEADVKKEETKIEELKEEQKKETATVPEIEDTSNSSTSSGQDDKKNKEKDNQGHHWGTDEKEDSHDIEHKNDNKGKYGDK